MLAAVYRGDHVVRVEDVERPQIGPGELLVRIGACGVCATDLAKIDYATHAPPRIFGHEMAGVVAEVGAGVEAFALGDRVQVYHHIPCRSCRDCDRGLYAQCAGYKQTGVTAGFEPSGGGFSEYVRVLPWIVDGGGVTRVPDHVALDVASFLEPVNTCLKCVRVVAPQPGDAVLVVGAGSIGLLLIRLLVLEGCRVFASDLLPDRRQRALDSGATAAFDPTAGDLAEALTEAGVEGGAHAAVLAVKSQAAFDGALQALRPGGRVVLFAHTRMNDPITVDGGEICAQEKQVIGAYSADVDLNEAVADLVFSGRLRVDDLITHRFPLEQTEQAFDLARRPRDGSLKVIVDCSADRASGMVSSTQSRVSA